MPAEISQMDMVVGVGTSFYMYMVWTVFKQECPDIVHDGQ
jgi:hypothetical protein